MHVGSGTFSTCFKASTYVLVHNLHENGSGTGSTYFKGTKTRTGAYVGAVWYCLHVFRSTYVAPGTFATCFSHILLIALVDHVPMKIFLRNLTCIFSYI